MQWLDDVQGNVGRIHSLDFYEGCIETMYLTCKIKSDEYDERMQWIQDQEAKKTKELLERVK